MGGRVQCLARGHTAHGGRATTYHIWPGLALAAVPVERGSARTGHCSAGSGWQLRRQAVRDRLKVRVGVLQRPLLNLIRALPVHSAN